MDRDNQTCFGCANSILHTESTYEGRSHKDVLRCHRYPPRVMEDYTSSGWPEVNKDDWCREFEPMEDV